VAARAGSWFPPNVEHLALDQPAAHDPGAVQEPGAAKILETQRRIVGGQLGTEPAVLLEEVGQPGVREAPVIDRARVIVPGEQRLRDREAAGLQEPTDGPRGGGRVVTCSSRSVLKSTSMVPSGSRSGSSAQMSPRIWS